MAALAPTAGRAYRRASIPRALLAATLVALAGAGLLAPLAEAKTPRKFFGLTAVRPTPADFNRMGNIGAGSFRVEIGWPSVQSSKDAPYTWRATDERFQRAIQNGMRPTPVLVGAPEFITGDGKNIRPPVKSPEQRGEWKEFAAAALERYGPGGIFWLQNPTLNRSLVPWEWIIWNEQNARAFWHPQASPRQYAKLLRSTRKAFDSVNPAVRMIAGGMYGFPGHEKSMTARKFAKRLYRERGAKEAIDGISVHPYAPAFNGLKKQVKTMRRVMNRSGDRRARIYIGETGWASAGPKNNFVVKNKKRQARLLERSYKFFLVKRQPWRIKSVFWFTFRDYGGNEICAWCPKAGLLNRRSQMKPAGEVFEALIAKKVG